MSEGALIPKVTSNKFEIRFQDKFDKRSVVNMLEDIRLKMPTCKKLFNTDLEVLRNVPARFGLHRAIVYFLGPENGLFFLQNTDIENDNAVSSHPQVLLSWLNDPERASLVKATGFATDDMTNYMHTYIRFDEDGEPVWQIDRGNTFPEWFVRGNFSEEQIALFLSKNFGFKNEFDIVPPDL